MEMNAPEILICESALKVKIEQSYGIWNWHKVCLNKFQMKKATIVSTFSFYKRSFFDHTNAIFGWSLNDPLALCQPHHGDEGLFVRLRFLFAKVLWK